MYYIFDTNGTKQAVLQNTTSIQWKLNYNSSTASQIVALATEENMTYLKKWGFILRLNGRWPMLSVMFIEYLEYSEDGQTITIKGHPDILGNVVNLTTQTIKNISSIGTLLSNNARFSPYTYTLYNSYLQPTLPDLTPSETTFKTLRETVESFCTLQDCGYLMEWTPYGSPTNFMLRFYTNPMSTTNSGVFGDTFGNILTQQYIEDLSEYKNIAYVYGEETDEGRKSVTVDLRKTGEPSQELYVDARDLQSTYKDSSGTEQTYTTEEYEQLLRNRGIDKLAETTSDAYQYKLEVDPDNSLCRLGVDYNLGSTVRIHSKRYGFYFTARVSAITYTEEPGNSTVSLTIDILNKEE